MPSPTDSRISSRCRVARCSASSASCCSVTSMPWFSTNGRSPGSCMRRLRTAMRRIDAVAAPQRQRALPLFLALQRVQAILERRRSLRVHQLRHHAPHQRFGAIAQRLRRERVQRGQPSLHRAGKDKSQAVLHHLAVAGLACQQRLLHLALVGHVLPAHNQVLNLAVRSLQRPQRPTHAPAFPPPAARHAVSCGPEACPCAASRSLPAAHSRSSGSRNSSTNGRPTAWARLSPVSCAQG